VEFQKQFLTLAQSTGIQYQKTITMKIFERIDADIKAAMLAREKEKLEALRAVKTALLLARSEKGVAEPLTDETELKVIRKLISQREEAAEIYKKEGREDLYQKEINEAKFISAYLPPMMSIEEIEKELKSLIAEMGASGPSDFGKVMGAATKRFAGKADNKIVAAKLKEILG